MNKMKLFFLLLLAVVGNVSALSFQGCLNYVKGKKASVDHDFVNKVMNNMQQDYNNESLFTKDEFEMLCEHNYCSQLLDYYSLIAAETNTNPKLVVDIPENKQAAQQRIKMTLDYLKSQQKE